MELRSVASQLVGNLLLLRNGEGVDAEIFADAAHNEESPAEVDNKSKEEVAPQVVQFEPSANLREAKSGQVAENSTADERPEHDSPVGERLVRQVGEDHLGCHATKDECQGQAEEHKMVLLHERAVRREDPQTNGNGIYGHRSPLKKDRGDGEAVLASRLDDVVHAERDLGKNERADDEADPDVSEGGLTEEIGQAGQVLAQEVVHGLSPDPRTINARHDHDQAGNEQAFGGTVDNAQVECVCMIGFPGREEHGEARTQRGEDTGVGGSQTHGGRLEQAGESAVERIDTVVEEFAETARGSRSAGLFAIDIVHGLVHEQSEGEAEVDP